MRLAFSPGSLGMNAKGKTYSLSLASVRIFNDMGTHRVQSNGTSIKGDGMGRITGAVYINDGRFVDALWLFVGTE